MEARVAHHRRDVVVDENGRATVTVILVDVEFDQELVLATVAPPFNGVDFDKSAPSYGVGSSGGNETTQRSFFVEHDVTRRGVAVALMRTDRPTKIPKLTWSFRVTNAYPFTVRDLVVPGASFYEEGAEERAGRGCVLHVASKRLTLSLRFESPESVFAIRTTRAIAEEQEKRWNGIRRRWIPAEVQPLLRVDENHVFSVTIDSPVVGHRYSIACFPEESVRRPLATPEWQEAMFLISDVLQTRGDVDTESKWLRFQLKNGLQRELRRQYGFQPLNCTVAAFLWSPIERILRPVYGRFPVDHWGSQFKYGEGVAGHAFRFDRVATYYRHRNDTLIYRSGGLVEYEWVVCIPLRYADIIIGVVSFAGKRELHDPVSGELGALAAAFPFDADQVDQFRVLEFRVNIAFLSVMANSAVVPPALQKRILAQWEKLAQQEESLVHRAMRSDPNVPRQSEAPLASSRPQELEPIGQSLVPVSESQRPPTISTPSPKGRVVSWTKVVVAAITTMGVVLGAGIKAFGPNATKGEPAASKPLESATVMRPPARNVYDRDRLLLLMESADGLRELATLDDAAREVPLDHSHLSNHMLYRACLQRFRFEESDFTSTDLEMARLDDTDLTKVRMDQGKCSGADFRRAKMASISLKGAELKNADLRTATLIDADLRNATLQGATLGDADLSGADLTGANLTGIDLRNVQGLTQTQLRAACSDGETLVARNLRPPKRCRPGR